MKTNDPTSQNAITTTGRSLGFKAIIKKITTSLQPIIHEIKRGVAAPAPITMNRPKHIARNMYVLGATQRLRTHIEIRAMRMEDG